MFPSSIPISVRSITDPAGIWRYPEERSSPLLSGTNRSLFKVSKESFKKEKNGNNLDKTEQIVGVDVPFLGGGNPVSCNERGRIGGFLDWLEESEESSNDAERWAYTLATEHSIINSAASLSPASASRETQLIRPSYTTGVVFSGGSNSISGVGTRTCVTWRTGKATASGPGSVLVPQGPENGDLRAI